MKLVIEDIPGYKLYQIVYDSKDNIKEALIGQVVKFDGSSLIEKVDFNRPKAEHDRIIKNLKGLVGI